VYAQDAALAVDEMLRMAEPPVYDYVAHDVFSAGTLPAQLLAPAFFAKLRR
jgi:hypothetical protein